MADPTVSHWEAGNPGNQWFVPLFYDIAVKPTMLQYHVITFTKDILLLVHLSKQCELVMKLFCDPLRITLQPKFWKLPTGWETHLYGLRIYECVSVQRRNVYCRDDVQRLCAPFLRRSRWLQSVISNINTTNTLN